MIDSTRINLIPSRPGCYLFKDAAGKVLYVGKAQSLRNRVRSYFNPTGQGIRTQAMMAKAADVDTIVTDSEMEALILESNLIKQYRPKYNVRLRDDKRFPYICVSVREPFPRVFRVRRTRKDGSRYFGPYANSGSLNETLRLLKKLFPYRSCDIDIPDETGSPGPVLPRPCLEYFIKRCTAPCVRFIDRSEYNETISQVLLFLEGKHDQVLSMLKHKMRDYAREMNFEGAAQVRDQIQAVERVVERQKISSPGTAEYDIVGVALGDRDASAQVFRVRGGGIVERERFALDNLAGLSAEEVLSAFLRQFYERATYVPRRILLPVRLPDAGLLSEWLSSLRQGPVSIDVPQRGQKHKLVQMVSGNAEEALSRTHQEWLADRHKTSGALTDLQEALGLAAPPARIECFDISTIQGSATVASMVVFQNGKSKPGEYRRFKIQHRHDGPDDFAAMQEVIRRRFRRAGLPEDEGTGWARIPDLVIIDGGKGQLNAALEALSPLGIESLQIASLAKRQEDVFLPGRSDPVILPRDSEALYLIQRIRDEAHRFAVTYHRQVRSKRAVFSQLDEIRGIGPVKRRALIRTFGSVRGIRAASVDELAAVPGINPDMAETLKQHLAE